MRTKYAIRMGFGREGHGQAIYVAQGRSCAEAKTNAIAALEQQFGGLWASKLRDTWIGGKGWLRREFPYDGLEEAFPDEDAPAGRQAGRTTDEHSRLGF